MKRRAICSGITLAMGLGLALVLLRLLGGSQAVAEAQGPDGYDVYYVAPSCAGVPVPCFTAVQSAVDAADDPGDVVKVAAGTYTGVSARAGVTQVVYISKTVTLRGGYTTTNWTASYPITQPTTLDAQGQGRVLYISGEISPTIEGLRITGGDADYGGGVFLDGSPATLGGNWVFGNTADWDGGGLFLNGSGATLSGNVVSSNIAQWGGGLGLDGASDALLLSNTIISNTATDSGGGLSLDGSDTTLASNLVADNRADVGGSGLFIFDCNPRLLHTTIARNTGGDGSGIFVDGGWDWPGSRVALVNTILVSHTVGITVAVNNHATLDATLWGSGAWANRVDWGGDGSIVTGSLNIWQDPLFVDPDVGDYHISSASPARDGGLDVGVYRDIDDQVRPMGWRYDIGADEHPGAGLGIVKQPARLFVHAGEEITYTIIVASVGMEDVTGVLLTDTLDDWQRPIAATSSAGGCSLTDDSWGGTVVCTPGTLLTGAKAVVTLTAQVSTVAPLRPKMVNTVLATANETANHAHATTYWEGCQARVNHDTTEYTSVQAAVDAANPDDLVKIAGVCYGAGERAGQHQQVYLTKTVTLRGGYAIDDWDTPDPDGHPTTVDALGQGRVIYITGEISPTIEGLRITGGNAEDGGGVYVDGSAVTIRRNWVFGNTASRDGGGLFLEWIWGGATLSENTINDNVAERFGGGLSIEWSDYLALTNNVIADNRANDLGSGLYVYEAEPRLRHTTFARNQGSGVYVEGYWDWAGCSAEMTNTILVSHGVGILVGPDASVSLEATLWGSGQWANRTDWEKMSAWSEIVTGSVNIWGDPAFLNPELGDYHIGLGSAALDAGVDAGVTTDVDGEPRPWGSGYDIGADEFRPALSVSKQATPDPVPAGAQLTYTLRVTNTGYVSLRAVITDVLPSHVIPAGLLTWTPTIAAPGGVWSQTIVLTVEVGYSGTLTNTLSVATLEGATGSASVTVRAVRYRLYLPLVLAGQRGKPGSEKEAAIIPFPP